MKVRAKMNGYIYHKRRFEGDVFELKPIKGHLRGPGGELKPVEFTVEQQFSNVWMEKLDQDHADEVVQRESSPKRHKRKVEIAEEPISSDDDVI